MIRYRIFILILLLSSQAMAFDFILPAINYRPETDWSFGAVYLKTLRFRNELETSRPSSFRFGGLVSVRGNWSVQLSPEFYWNDEEYRLNAEIGYFNIPDRFFGVGAYTNNDQYVTYTSAFPRLRVSLRKQWEKKYGVGPVLEFEQRVNQPAAPIDAIGSTGARTLGLGFILSYDTRNELFYPASGEYIEVSSVFFTPAWFSQFSFFRQRLDYRKFISWDEKKTILAFQYWMQGVFGEVPFTSLSTIGGSRVAIGYWDGRLRDKIAYAAQIEARRKIWNKLGGAAFLSAGSVGSSLDVTFQKIFPSGGFGFRYQFDEKDNINARLDLAWGVDSFGFYLQLGEAF